MVARPDCHLGFALQASQIVIVQLAREGRHVGMTEAP